MADGASSVLFQYGVAGVAIFGMAIAIVYLWKDNQNLRDRIIAEKDARRLDAKETLEKVAEPLAAISQSTGYIYDKLVLGKKDC